MIKHSMRQIRSPSVILLLAAHLSMAQPKQTYEKLRPMGGNVHLAKISGELQVLIAPKSRMDSPLLELPLILPGSDVRVEVEIWLRDLEEDSISSLAQLEMELMAIYPHYSRVMARLDAATLSDVAALENVILIRHNQKPFSMGSNGFFSCPDAVSQADGFDLFGTRRAREEFGVDGDQIKIGIISDSFRTRLEGDIREESPDENGCKGIFFENSAPQAADADELPASIRLLDNGPGGGTDEGRALAELIHDTAPEAEILFHTGVRDMADFADGIEELKNCGADIIIDDLLYPREPMFQPGLIQRAASKVADSVLYLSSAGNQGDGGIDQTYQDSALENEMVIPATGTDFHEFPSGEHFAEIEIAPGCGAQFVLQWDEPFPEKLGDKDASTDLDLYLCTSPDARDCIYGSNGAQGCGRPNSISPSQPIEISSALINQSGISQTVFLAVDHFCGDPQVHFRIVTLPITGPQCTLASPQNPIEFRSSVFNAPQIYGHAAAREVAAVAAIHYREIEFNGLLQMPVNQLNAQPFSALGGEIPGSVQSPQAMTPEETDPVVKPEFTAPDATNTTFFNRNIDLELDDCPNFLGTSAAVAHAAGAAALVMQANPDLKPQQIIEILKETATPLADARRSGAGLINAYEAVKAAKMRLPAPLPITGPQLKPGPILHWTPVQTALAYRVQVREESTGNRVLFEETLQSSLEVPSSMLSKAYQWRVAAVNAHGQGAWSPWTGLGPSDRSPLPAKQ